MKMNPNPLLLLLGIISASPTHSDPVGVKGQTRVAPAVELRPPKSASNAPNVSQGFVGFGIEMSSFTEYGGIDRPNNFSNNLMSAISTRTGAPVHIRVGGTSMDNTIFNASNPNALTATGDQATCDLHTNVTIGGPWLSAFKSFPVGTRFTVQVPLARDHPSNRVEFSRACIAAMPSNALQLEAIEIGNEPDLYPALPKPQCGSPDRPADYGPTNYAAEWTAAAANMSAQVEALKGQKSWFQAMTLSSGVNQQIWNVTASWDAINNGGFPKTVSQHYYQANACGNLQDELMNHSKTVSMLETTFGTTVSFFRDHGIPFVLGEVGSALWPDRSCTPNLHLYGSLGGALWTADMMLYAMTMGIERISMQQGTNFNFSAWQPITTPFAPKAVRGNWYGHVFAADFLGSEGNFQIHPLPIDAAYPNVVGYAGYNSGLLTKLAVLDMRFWNDVNGTERPALNIELAGLDGDITGVRVSRLTAPGGSSVLDDISWAGKRWTADDDGKEPTGNDSVVINVNNGSLAGNVTVWASQALGLEMIRAET